MNATLTTALVFACLLTAVLLGILLRRLVPKHHLSPETKDTVKLAMGLVATMSALLLGLLVSSAKGSYDTARSEAIQMAAKIAFLDRVLALYGPETAEARAQFRNSIKEVVQCLWQGADGNPASLAPNTQAADAFYGDIQRLSPQDDMQRNLKAHATALATGPSRDFTSEIKTQLGMNGSDKTNPACQQDVT